MNLRGMKYVVRRGDSFQLRLPIPKDLQDTFGRKELRWSLKTESRSVAARRAYRAGLVFLQLCDTVRGMQNISDGKIIRMVQAFYRTLCDAYEPASFESLAHKASRQNATSEAREGALADLESQRELGSYSAATRTTAKNLAQKENIDFEAMPSVLQQKLLEGIVRAYVEQARYVESRAESLLDDYIPADHLFLHSGADVDPDVGTASHLIAKLSDKPNWESNASLKPKDPTKTVAALAQVFLKRGREQGVTSHGPWATGTTKEYAKVLRWFCEHVGGDTDVRDIEVDHVREFRNAIERLRKGAPGSAAFSDAQTDAPDARVVPKTAAKYFDYSKLFLKWMAEEGHIKEPPGYSLSIKVPPTPTSQQRQPFTPEEVEKFLSAPVFMGCDEAKRRRKPGKLKIKDDRFWAPLLLIYSGMRVGEVITIALDRVFIDCDHPHIQLSADVQNLKTASAARLVPIHPDLIEIGFLDFVRSRKKKPLGARLFGGIQSKGHLSNYYSKELNRLIDSAGIKDTRLVAHSFRHYFIDCGRNSGIDEASLKRIVGHSMKGDVTAGYGKGFDLAQSFKIVSAIDLKISDETKARLKSNTAI